MAKGFADLLGETVRCSCGREHTFPTRRIILKRGAIEETASLLGDLSSGEKALLVADEITYDVAGRDVENILRRGGIRARSLIFEDTARRMFVGDDRAVERVVEAGGGDASVVVTVGAGTLNDVGKLGSFRLGVPHVIVATAPSMDGYVSPVAPIIVEGFKKTFPAAPPAAVVADLDVLCRAPMEMLRAGFGDILGKVIANLDWNLSHLLKGEFICREAWKLIEPSVNYCFENAESLPLRDEGIVTSISEGLIVSGLAMVMAGNSRPASGCDHLCSHFWEMLALREGREHSLHGLQVCVGAILASKLYEKLLQMPADAIDVERARRYYRTPEEREERVRELWGDRISEILLRDVREKFLSWEDHRAELMRIKGRWDRIREELSKIARPFDDVRRAVESAGAPQTIKEIEVSEEGLRDALIYARELRTRYTAFDLAATLGVLEPLADEIISESGVMGG
ncbi:MAG: sn-glycerol-1-phosphate dehydrogenase [bacterium]